MHQMYQILDEPQPSKWNHLTVNPIWPLFGMMFGGSWLSFTWYAFNAYAMGCPNRIKTLIFAVCGFAVSIIFVFFIFLLGEFNVVNAGNVRYVLLILLGWKLGVAYYLYLLQARTFHIYEYFGNMVRNGILIVIIGAVFGQKYVLSLFDSTFWKLVMR
jgi:hypothetical protein